jgi:hypothetical protein
MKNLHQIQTKEKPVLRYDPVLWWDRAMADGRAQHAWAEAVVLQTLTEDMQARYRGDAQAQRAEVLMREMAAEAQHIYFGRNARHRVALTVTFEEYGDLLAHPQFMRHIAGQARGQMTFMGVRVLVAANT